MAEASQKIRDDTRILVVDNYKTMLRIIRNLLSDIGFKNVDEATDGSAALESLRANNYDLVISDWNMDPMNGLELLREIRADDHLKLLPFILVSADSRADVVVTAKKAGVNSFIVKPFNAATLRAKVEAVIG